MWQKESGVWCNLHEKKKEREPQLSFGSINVTDTTNDLIEVILEASSSIRRHMGEIRVS